jgi:ribosomal protein S27E
MSRLSEIVEGWRNHMFPPEKIKEVILEVSSERMKVCEQCEHISTKHSSVRPDVHCVECGCTLSAKTKCLTCECPIKKWTYISKDAVD